MKIKFSLKKTYMVIHIYSSNFVLTCSLTQWSIVWRLLSIFWGYENVHIQKRKKNQKYFLVNKIDFKIEIQKISWFLLLTFYIKNGHFSDAPSSPPKLNTDTSVPVHEGQPIMLQCSLSTLANPPVTWRWVCGEENLIPEKLHNDTQSTLNFTANRKYNQKTCQCWATSPIISLSYNQSSKAKIITVYCK